MEKPKSITQLSKEQLEDMCLNLMHVDNEKAKIIEQLETNRDKAIALIDSELLKRQSNLNLLTQKILIKLKTLLKNNDKLDSVTNGEVIKDGHGDIVFVDYEE